MFIAIVKYIKPIATIDALLADHIRFLEEQFLAGHFIASGRIVPRTGGVILARGPSREDVEAILYQDPFYTSGAAEYEVIEFTPTKAGRGFEILMNAN
ncbi:MAG: hypothetical protein HQL17_00915 [Candidatus Omnitrophica bacterium]|nr:hypothetical protein [Candidatus Omnitrophota bacterium]